MANCLDNLMCGDNILIGIDGYYTSSISNLRINDLPGLSIKTAAAVASTETISGYKLIKDKIVFATKLVIKDLQTYINPYFIINSVVDSDNSGDWGDYYLPYAALERGLVVKRKRSNFAKILIKDVSIYGQTDIATTLKITDGGKVYNYPITLIAGTETIHQINLQAETEEVYITLDNSAISLKHGLISSSNYNGCSTCHGKHHSNIWTRGWSGIVEDSNLYGIKARAVLICDDSDIFCDLINKMDVLVLYKSGIEIYKEYLMSNRLNNITLFSKEHAEAQLETLQNDYNKMYKAFKETIINYLNNKKDVCIKCNSDRYVSTHP